MDTKTFLENFGHIADAPNGVQRLRELILVMGIEGRLGTQKASDESAEILFRKIEQQRDALVKAKKIRKQVLLPKVTKEEIDVEIPSNWKWVHFGDLGDWGAGSTPDRKKSVYYGGRIPWFKSGELTGGVINQSEETVTEKALAECSLRLNQPGDVLIAMYGATIGKVAIMGIEGTTNQAVCACTCFNGLDNQFMLLLLKAYKSRFVGQGAGGAQPNISRVKIVTTLAPLPPLEEQKRIVAKVDQLMTLCDQLEFQQKQRAQTRVALNNAALDKLLTALNFDEFNHHWQRIANNFHHLYDNLENVTKLRGGILQLAAQGKIVSQNPSDEPAQKLLGRLAKEKEALIVKGLIKKPKQMPPIKEEDLPFNIPANWKWIRIWDVAELITSGSRDWAKYYSDSGAIFVTMGNLSRGNYQLRLDNIRYVNPPRDGEGSRTKLEANDLLISITGDVGNLGLIPEDFGEAYINQHTCLLRFMPICRNRYLPEVLRSPLATYQFNAPQRGVKNSFRLGDVGEMIIPLPPLEEQKRIVAKVDQLMALCDQLETKLKQTQTTSGKLVEATVKSLVAA